MTPKTHNSNTKLPNFARETHSLEDINYIPSVPIYIYRQLVEELKKTQFNLETLRTQNQALLAQNNQLKKEVTLISNSAQNLQNILDHKDTILELKTKSELKLPIDNSPVKTPIDSSVSITNPQKSVSKISTRKSQRPQTISEVAHNTHHIDQDSQTSKEVKGLWLMILVVLLFFSCFVGSFFVAKAFLNDNNNSR